VLASGRRLEVGMRVQPEHARSRSTLYDPCAPRLAPGHHPPQPGPDLLDGSSGLHFHTLCEQDADVSRARWPPSSTNFGDLAARA
jgi:carboxynorspermidine decarboxylase